MSDGEVSEPDVGTLLYRKEVREYFSNAFWGSDSVEVKVNGRRYIAYSMETCLSTLQFDGGFWGHGSARVRMMSLNGKEYVLEIGSGNTSYDLLWWGQGAKRPRVSPTYTGPRGCTPVYGIEIEAVA